MSPENADSTSLSPMAEEALAHLRARFAPDESFTYERAIRVLETRGIETVLAEDLLETLLLRGYLYEVGDELRITD